MRRFWTPFVVLSILLGIGPAVPAAAEPVPIADPYVFTSDDVGFADGSDPAGRVGRLAAMDEYVGDKSPIVRLDAFWNDVQKCKGCAFDWSPIDPTITAAHERGMRVLLILDYSAAWANDRGRTDYFPTDDAAWQAFVTAAVTHFGDRVQAYEVWNEPNLKTFGNYLDNTVDQRAGRYWQLVRLAYERVKAACAQCVVLAGGSAGGDAYYDSANLLHNDNEPADWLEWAYQNGFGDYFDAVAHHPYPDWYGGNLPSYAKYPCVGPTWYQSWSGFGPDDPSCGGLAAQREVMVRHGDGDKKIWGTEFGFPTVGWRPEVTIGVERVRDALEEGIRMWRSRPYTGPLIVYSFQDTQTSFPLCANPKEAECHFGLRDAAGKPKEPMYSDIRTALIGKDWSNMLLPERSLFRGSQMRSPDGRHHLVFEASGYVVLYRVAADGTRTERWKQGGPTAYRLHNRMDGNLVLLDQSAGELWSTRTAGQGGSTLHLQDDGNLVQYKPTWASNTA
jgi:hypothetical protein